LDKRHGGRWEFPGGKLDPGESHLEAAARELGEELAVAVVSAGPIEYAVRDPGSSFEIAFLPVEISGVPECREHSAIAWAPIGELLSYDLAPSDRQYVQWLTEQEGPL
jgi:8-oxo-dGTP pyrophosphatase MutT (NUDIX family)